MFNQAGSEDFVAVYEVTVIIVNSNIVWTVNKNGDRAKFTSI